MMVQGKVARYNRGEMIIVQGSNGDRAFHIESGRVLVFIYDGDGKAVPITELTPGDTFGEMFLMDPNGKRNASAMAMDNVELSIVFKDEMDFEYQRMDTTQKKIAEMMAQRINTMNKSYLNSR